MENPGNVTHEALNREQDDEQAQAHMQVAPASDYGLGDTVKVGDSGLMDDSTQDLVDHMTDMVASGRIDMAAYNGEPNMDDDAGLYGEGHDTEFAEDDS